MKNDFLRCFTRSYRQLCMHNACHGPMSYWGNIGRKACVRKILGIYKISVLVTYWGSIGLWTEVRGSLINLQKTRAQL